MAQYDYLPIYKKAFDLCVYTKKIIYFFVHLKFPRNFLGFEQIVKNFSRYNKYTIGSDFGE